MRGPRTEPGTSPIAPLGATHQLLCGRVLDEPRTVTGLPSARDPHPWEMQGRGAFSMGGRGDQACPSFQAPLAGLSPRTHSPGQRGWEAQALGSRPPICTVTPPPPTLSHTHTRGSARCRRQ